MSIMVKDTSGAERKQKVIRNHYIIRLSLFFIVNIILVILILNGFDFLRQWSMLISLCCIVNKFCLSDLAFVIMDKVNFRFHDDK